MIAELLLIATLAPDLPQWTADQEGYRDTPYLDTTGTWTIGYGRRCSERSPSVSKRVAREMLMDDLQAAAEGARRVYPDIASLPPAARFVLVAMAFQLGARGLAGFRDMKAAIARDDYAAAAGEIIASRFANQCPARARDLASRLAGAKP